MHLNCSILKNINFTLCFINTLMLTFIFFSLNFTVSQAVFLFLFYLLMHVGLLFLIN